MSKREENALVSEYGQPEMTVLPNGQTIITDEPTMMDLPKNTVIFNEEQTRKIMNNKPHAIGNAYVSGTNDEGWFTLPDGHMARPLREGDRGYDMLQKFNAYMSSIDNNVGKLSDNIMHGRSKQIHDVINQINSSDVVNNNKNVQQPVYNTFNISMPNITNSTCAEELLNDLQSISRKKYQINW